MKINKIIEWLEDIRERYEMESACYNSLKLLIKELRETGVNEDD